MRTQPSGPTNNSPIKGAPNIREVFFPLRMFIKFTGNLDEGEVSPIDFGELDFLIH